jgi:hypothetical protein
MTIPKRINKIESYLDTKFDWTNPDAVFNPFAKKNDSKSPNKQVPSFIAKYKKADKVDTKKESSKESTQSPRKQNSKEPN